MGSSNSQPYKQNYVQNTDNSTELDPAVKQFLQNLNMFTNAVCQQSGPNSASGPNNTVVFYPVEQQQNHHHHHRFSGPDNSPFSNPSVNPYGENPYGENPYGESPYGQNPYGQNPYGQNPYGQNPFSRPSVNPYAESPYSNIDPSDQVIIIERENYENSHDSFLNYGTIKDTWKRQAKYSL
jgi:hypothetical protein